jgi:hypothetical protein
MGPSPFFFPGEKSLKISGENPLFFLKPIRQSDPFFMERVVTILATFLMLLEKSIAT